MLTYESLIEQAKLRSMPPTKMRGILREYLQVLVLKELYKLEMGKRLYFTGGTYLRLIHGLKRFSEDLDFNTISLAKNEFEDLLRRTKNELKRVDIESNLKFAHWGNVFVAKLAFPDVENSYEIKSKYSKPEGIIIKIEANKIKSKIKSETKVVSEFGELYPCACTDSSVLFADKIDALCRKNRGRHIYDIMFLLSNKHSIDKDFMKKVLGIKKAPLEAISDRINGFSKSDLKKQAETLRPFLFNESEADLIASAHEIIPQLITKYSA